MFSAERFHRSFVVVNQLLTYGNSVFVQLVHTVSASNQHNFSNHNEKSDSNLRARKSMHCGQARHVSSTSNNLIPDTVPVVSQQDDWREFRAKLVRSSQKNMIFMGEEYTGATFDESLSDNEAQCSEDHWAHVLAHPEKGCLLLANPLMFTTGQTYFNKAVILLFSHGTDGSAGIMLNKPTQHVMKEFKDASTLPDAYDDCTLYLGGDVGPEVLNILHQVDGVDDSDQIVPGVYLGGVHGVANALESGKANASDVKLMTRYAGWRPGQLEEEVKAGVWIVTAASRDVIMGRYATNACPTGESVIAHGDDAWHSVLQLMGGEYAELSDAVSEEYRADIMEISQASDIEEESSTDAGCQQFRDNKDAGEDGFLGHGI